MSLWPSFSISDGTEERNRSPRALEPGYFQPDERRFEELLALGADLGRILPFRDLRGQPKGTWGDLFMSNEAAVMALVLSQDSGQLEFRFRSALELGLEEAVRFTYETARDMDLWLTQLGECRGRAGIELSERFEALVHERLAASLGDLLRLMGALGKEPTALGGIDPRGFHRAWGGDAAAQGATPFGDGSVPAPGSADLREEVCRIFSSFLHVIVHLQSLIPPYLSESLEDQTHEPGIALFIVFLKLLETARLRLNGFTERHLDFYYRDVLGAGALPDEPDYAFLSLGIAPGKSEVPVPAGTEFVATIAGEDREILFASDQEALVSDVAVDTLCTLYFERDRFISPESELGYVTRIKALRRDLGAGGEAGSASALPFFGADSRFGEDARVGFAVASPILLLREGQRTIDVQIELGDPGESSHLRNEVLRHAEGGGIRGAAGLVEVFSRFLSAEPGWLDVAAVADSAQLAQGLAASVDPEEAERAFQGTLQTGRNQVYDLFLRTLLRRGIGSAGGFFRLLGRIFSRNLLTTGEPPDDELSRDIRDRAQNLLQGESLDEVMDLLNRGHQEIFQKLLKGIFEISLTAPSGWYQIPKYVMSRPEGGSETVRAGLRFLLNLGPEADPIVPYSPEIHGGQWGGTSPMVRFRLNPQASFYAYSLLSESRLSAVVIDVRVRGLRDLRLSNNVGRIDPSKPFQPFGPMPTLSSYFSFGSFEMAMKQLTELTLKLEWGDLPRCFGGFASHYADYDQAYRDEVFQVDVSVLQNGIWQPSTDGQRQAARLFEPTGPTDKLKSATSIDIRVLDFHRPIDCKTAEEQFDLQQSAGNGFFRLGLSGPEGAFGHLDYPILLAKSLSENLRSKVFKKVPSPPYTPMISQVSVDYAARGRILVDEAGTADQSERAQRIFHLHPFGYEEIEPSRSGRSLSLLPKYETDGNLFIGVTGGGASQSLELLFHLTEETDQQTYFEAPVLAWYYLSVGGWRRLPPANLVLDTTNGFLGSGVVTLVLPEDTDRQSTLMPAGKAWVCVGADSNLAAYPDLNAVHANGIRATRRIDAAAGRTGVRRLPAGSTWRPLAPVAGLAAISQVGASSGGAPAESPRRFRTRVSERLCHKNRAVTARDYERLVLQRFPDLFKVKCFPGLTTTDADPRPGQILIVVVPRTGEETGGQCRRPMIDVLQLKEIRRFVQQVASPFVQVEVRNPLYERIQVRCKAKFTDDTNPGRYIRKLNQEVSGFLCPWVPFGYQARFGWMISCDEVMGFIRDRDYVEFVSDFSMLHITEDNPDYYTLADTVRRSPADEADEGEDGSSGPIRYQRSNMVRWRYPWSLALPMDRHFIGALRSARPIEPEPVGIGELAIGRTLIIKGTD